jgi:predicted nucleic acid-binding protein
MTAPCFVDANVLVYWRDKADSRKQEIAGTLMQRLWSEQSGRISVQVLNEFYAVSTRKIADALSRDDAWAVVVELFEWNPQPLNEALLVRAKVAEGRYRLSWWDSLIVAAAQLQNCKVLYTEDMHHGMQFGNVRVCNPFIAQVQEEPPAAYMPPVVSRHRPRGRPRKAA